MTDETADPPKEMGRPTAYRPHFCELAANLYLQGNTDFEVAEALGVHVSTLYRWRHEHPEFREALRLGKEAADERVERSLYHRAVGYSHKAVKILQNNGVPVIVPYVEHVPPDVGAATLWLTNRKPEDWRSKQSHELTGQGGGPIQTEEVTDLEKARRIAHLLAAGLRTTESDSRPAAETPPST